MNINKAYKAVEQTLDSQGAKSKWDEISDPEERKRAILAKHGFKPHTGSDSKTSSNIDDVDTIPEHILKDEVLYRYLTFNDEATMIRLFHYLVEFVVHQILN